MKKLGLIINPIAGIGGRAARKGSDGFDTWGKAGERADYTAARDRAGQALDMLAPLREEIEILTVSGEMGEESSRAHGFLTTTVAAAPQGASTGEDTRRAAASMAEAGADLLLFAGGDGTARDICAAVGDRLPCLGIPAGVKIHSGVYAVNPRRAGIAAREFLSGSPAEITPCEVMDIDEEAFRQGRVSARLYGYLLVPQVQSCIQHAKAHNPSARAALDGMAEYLVETMEEDVLYIVGPGSTTIGILQRLGLPYTLLGVDAVKNGRLLAADADEKTLFALLSQQQEQGGKTKIIVTAIGGQGHIFGRGNQQLSPRVLRLAGLENIVVAASREKLLAIENRTLLVDTGDEELDRSLCGYRRVVCGYRDEMVCKIER